MSLSILLNEVDWDAPFFKRLPLNDTGASTSHQGGVVITKEMRKFFPALVNETSAISPTVDIWIEAELYVENLYLKTVQTRYQFQTWHGKRTPESRLTANLSDIRNLANRGDYLVMQRALTSLNRYRLILIRADKPEAKELEKLIPEKNWGLVGTEAPVTQNDLEKATADELAREELSFSLFDKTAAMRETRALRVARSVFFREHVRRQHHDTCCVCGTSVRTPDLMSEFEAAHIVPRNLLGSDDVRNGLGLCRRHHWAFDKGLYGFDKSRKVIVPGRIKSIKENAPLLQFEGALMRATKNPTLAPAPEALKWHLENVVGKWQ